MTSPDRPAALRAEGDAADRRIVMGALEGLDLAGLARAPFDRLSGGERQRVLIARALAQRAGTMVLDEPTNHLDLPAEVCRVDAEVTLHPRTGTPRVVVLPGEPYGPRPDTEGERV